MKKLSNKEYLMLIADAVVNAYGGTLMEGGTDIRMAKEVLKKLTPYLYFHPSSDVSNEDYNKWEVERNLESGTWEFVYDDEGNGTDKLTDGTKTWKSPLPFKDWEGYS